MLYLCNNIPTTVTFYLNHELNKWFK